VDEVAATVITTAMRDAAFDATAATSEEHDEDPFKAGDFVVYLAHGVGRIDSIGDEEIGGHRLRIIQISFAENRMTLRIPAVKARLAGLRRVAPPEALEAALATLQQPRRTSRMAWTKRAQDYLARINSGEIEALAGVVRDLQGAADGSGSSFSQRNLFELAIDRLAAEFAVAAGVDKTEAMARLTGALRKTTVAAAA
jgi:CarD family transcriptional regulator